MTVSKVMHDASDISATTKVRVRQIAQQMGYVPDAAAQNLRSRTTRLLGLVLSSIENPMLSRTIMGIEERAHELGYDLLIGQSMNLIEREERCIGRMLSRRVEGLFIVPVSRFGATAPIYEDLKRRGTPTLILGHTAPFSSHFPNVETDDSPASQSMTRHLVELGHRRIAFLAGAASSPSAQERLEGYRRGLREAKIDFDDGLIFHAGTSMEEGERAALQFLQERNDATAIQAVTDLVAMGAANILLNQGVRIPQDLSVAGFGNIFSSAHYRVPLTTIRQPKLRLGVAAMESMQILLRGERPPVKRLAAELVVRSSTAGPREAPRLEISRARSATP